MTPNPHADPHDNVSCPGCAQHESEIEVLEHWIERLEKVNGDLRLRLMAVESALALSEQLLDAYRPKRAHHG